MDCAKFEMHAVDLLYGEQVDAPLERELREHAAGCPSCGGGLSELSATRTFLSAWEDSDPPGAPVRLSGPVARPSKARMSAFRRHWLSVAAVLLCCVTLALVAANASVKIHSSGVEVRFGGPSDQGLGVDDASRMAVAMNRMIADSEERQYKKYLDVMQEVYFRMEDERRGDKQLVERNIIGLQDVYAAQLEKNNRLLELSLKSAKRTY